MPGITGLVRFFVFGRTNGFRAQIRRRMFGGRGAASASARPEPSGVEPSRPESGVLAGGSRPKEPPKNVNPPEGFEVVLHREALSPGEITEVIIGGTAVAIANVEGTFYAVSNTCPHAGGPIGDGKLDKHTVTCPYHGWSYDVRDGKCFVDSEVRLPTFDVRLVGDAVCLKL